jgi:hypothetical protein
MKGSGAFQALRPVPRKEFEKAFPVRQQRWIAFCPWFMHTQ